MKLWTRSLLAAAAGAALIGSAGCSPDSDAGDGSSGPTGTSSSEKVLAEVKPCEVLSSKALESFGLEAPGKPKSTLPWAPGCHYDGNPVALRLELNKRENVAAAEKKSTWAKFERVKVNGRSGARAIPQGATQARVCDVMFNAGKGMIQVRASEPRLPDDVDECQKALEIAKKVEPNVPEPA
ncbi:DUF3558 family protein [Actinopolyspora mzabensis]|uniref:DUF3558 family protein n=1 Tax=Actinopolyspora mzabensis TaxID=995066 RepID=UPI001FE0B494|nr:DUF3558 family protein [Actinopolyspora mzabensis]